MAGGEIVAFIDDDVRPEPGWVDALLPVFDDARVAAACGLVLPLALDTEPQVVFQHRVGFGGMGFAPLEFDAAFARACPGAVPTWDFGAGSNMAVRRETALRLGGFDERIGPGAAGGAADDSEFLYRALMQGHVVRYEPLSVVRHDHRRDWEGLLRQLRGHHEGHVAEAFLRHGRYRERRDLVHAFAWLPLYLGRLAVSDMIRRRRDPVVRAQVGGFLAGLRHVRLALGRQARLGGTRGNGPFAGGPSGGGRPGGGQSGAGQEG